MSESTVSGTIEMGGKYPVDIKVATRVPFLIQSDVNGEDRHGDEERAAREGEVEEGPNIGRLAQGKNFAISDVLYALHEGVLPGVELQHFHPCEGLVDQLDSFVFGLELRLLKLLRHPHGPDVERDQKDQDADSGEGGGAQLLVQEEDCQAHHVWRAPHAVEVGRRRDDALRIDGHVVGDLANLKVGSNSS